jgi:hypothetical protein
LHFALRTFEELAVARGWESKSVESQQDDARVVRDAGRALSTEARARLEQRKALELSLARARDERTRAERPAHKAMLDAAIAALEAEISALS